MTSYKELAKHPSKFLALTGYTDEEFQVLLPYFRVQFEQYVSSNRLDGRPRTKRRYTTYQNSPLPTIEDKLLFILIYLKQGETQELHATLFGIHQPDANKWVHRLHPLLNQALADLGELPARTAEELAQKLEQEVDITAETEPTLFFHDGTERPIPRPTNPDEQKLYYSGKKSNIC